MTQQTHIHKNLIVPAVLTNSATSKLQPPRAINDIRLRWQMKRKAAVTSLSNPSPLQPDYLNLCKKGFADTIFLLPDPNVIR